MADSKPFVNYYKILQLNPNCDSKILETAYHRLAKLYHPDHSETADVTKFTEVLEAYRALKNLYQRAEYDILHASNTKGEKSEYYSNDTEAEGTSTINVDFDEQSALNDADAHAIILKSLYKRRREHAREAGVGGFYLQERLNCSDEQFEFHIWYLKAKGFIETTEQGTLAITIHGIDHVISMSRTTMAENLRIALSSGPQE